MWLVPVVMALRQIGPNGVAPAEACAGGVPGAGWGSLQVADAYPETRVAIATDGFVLFDAVKVGGGFSLNDGDVTVHVADQGGTEVPGRLAFFGGHTDPLTDVSQLRLGWQADEPLELGAILSLSLSAGDLAEQSLELEVVGEPTPVPTPTAALDSWVDVRHGIGDVSSCEAGEDACGAWSIDVPSNEVKLRGVLASWAVPEITGMVAWEVRAEASDPLDAGEGPRARPVVVSRNVASRPSASAGVVTFAADAVDHCVVVVVKDLRTGEEVRSAPTCGEPAEPEVMVADHDLRDCWAPPTQESIPIWCEGRKNATEICDGHEAAGQGGSGSDEGGDIDEGRGIDQGSGIDEGGRVRDVGSGGDRGLPKPPADASESDGGCRFAPASGAWSSALLPLAALLISVARRRRAATRG